MPDAGFWTQWQQISTFSREQMPLQRKQTRRAVNAAGVENAYPAEVYTYGQNGIKTMGYSPFCLESRIKRTKTPWLIGEYVSILHAVFGGYLHWKKPRLPVWCYCWAPLKTTLLRFGRIFCPNFSFCKHPNTQSIPVFSKLNLGQNLSPKSSKNSF